MVEAIAAVRIVSLDTTEVVADLVDGLMGDCEVVVVVDVLTVTITSLGRYIMLQVLNGEVSTGMV